MRNMEFMNERFMEGFISVVFDCPSMVQHNCDDVWLLMIYFLSFLLRHNPALIRSFAAHPWPNVFFTDLCVFVWLDHWTLRWFIIHDQLCTSPGWEFVTQERAHPRYQEHWTSHQQGAINAHHFSLHCQKELQGFVKVDIFVETEHKQAHSIKHTWNLSSLTHDSSQWLKLGSRDGSWC